MEEDYLDFSKPNVYGISHEGQFIGIVDSREEPTFFETHPKDLIKKGFGDGVGVILYLAYHPQIQLYKFEYKKVKYSITKEKFLRVGREVKLGKIVKLVCHLTDCEIEKGKVDRRNIQLNLFD